MRLEEALYLIEARGLAGEAARSLALPDGGGAVDLDLAGAAGRQRGLMRLRALGYWKGHAVTWPEAGAVRRLAARLDAAGVQVAWRGARPYPEKLAERLGDDAPPWLLVAGGEARLERLACAMVGSRQTPPPFLDAAQRLAQALAAAGVVVVSGLAEGADRAAHQGALSAGPGGAGTIAIPARGLLHVDLSPCRPPAGGMTCLGAGRPDMAFHAGLAIRRNTLIPAMAEGLVLVASGLSGGSSYAVRWAMARGLPMWCFQNARATPPANAYLIQGGWAEPLALAEGPRGWLARLLPRLQQAGAAAHGAPAVHAQLDWLAAPRLKRTPS